MAFRTEEDGSRVYGDELSNVATATTEGAFADTNSPEPEGFSLLAETTYASANEGEFHSSDNVNFDIVDDAGAPRSSSKVARATFPAGLGDGVSPVWSEAAISSHSARQVYVAFWIKLSENWQGHSTGVNKVAIIWTHEKPVVVANVLGTDAGPLSSEIRIQDVPDGPRNLAPNLANPELVRGRWHRWELLLVSNVEGAADGEVHWWVDGTKVGAYADVRFGSASQSKVWDYVTWRPVWGGRGDVIEETQYMWMDHYYVSGAR